MLIPNITGTETVDRLPVLVTTIGPTLLLAMQKIVCETEEAQAKTIFFVLKDWSLENKVQGVCFDTNSCDAGQHIGACNFWRTSTTLYEIRHWGIQVCKC